MKIRNQIIFLFLSSMIAGCGYKSLDKGSEFNDPGASDNLKLSSEDIAGALGMSHFSVKITKDGTYGFTIQHQSGFEESAYSTIKAGESVKVVYWLEDDGLMYYIKENKGSSSGTLPLDKNIKFRLRQNPSGKRFYEVGEIVAKWTVNNQISNSDVINDGEIGLVFTSIDKAFPKNPVNLKSKSDVPETQENDTTKIQSNF